jgi:PAS domain S-box-containing protein
MSSAEYLPERVSMLYRLSGTDVPIILVAAGVTAFASWGYIGATLIAIWFVGLGVASTARYAMARIYRGRQSPVAGAAQWENYFCLVSAMVGAGWGLALMFVGETPTSLQELAVTFLIASAAMGLPPSLAPSPKAFASFILPVLAPMVAMLLTFGGGLNTSTALLMLVFATMLLGLYLSNHLALMETLAYGHENMQLLEKLRVAEKSLTLALAEQRLIFDTAAIGIAFVSQHSVLKCNRRFAEILGYTQEELTGQSTRVWLPPDQDFMQAGGRAFARLAQGENYSCELHLRRKDGMPIWVLADSRATDRAAPQAGIIIGIGDITQRKRAEVELLATLQREKELSEMKSKFVSIASHELRTPLATILSSAELLEHYADGLSAEDKLKMLHGIQGAVKRMIGTIEDVLVIGKAEAGALQFEPKPVDLGELCHAVVEELRGGVASQYVIRFERRFEHGSLNLDEKLLRHILTNLLSNAVKYSPPGSVVSLLLAERDGEAVIEVGDQGIGIPLEDQARMFESFHRASNVGNRQGTGLGMVIVKKAVELHGGTISVDSKIDAGTRISVRLPLPQIALRTNAAQGRD